MVPKADPARVDTRRLGLHSYLSSLEERIARLERRDEERSFLSDFAAPTSCVRLLDWHGQSSRSLRSSSSDGPPHASTSQKTPLAAVLPSPFPSEPAAATESPQVVDGMGALRFAPGRSGRAHV